MLCSEGWLRKELYMLIVETRLQQQDFLGFYVYKDIVSLETFERFCRRENCVCLPYLKG